MLTGESVMMKIVRIGGAERSIGFTVQTVPETAVPDVNYVPERSQVVMEEGDRTRIVTIRTLRNSDSSGGKLYVELLDPTGGVILGFQRRAHITIKRANVYANSGISTSQKVIGSSLIWISLLVGFGLTVFAVVYTVKTNKRKSADEMAFLVIHHDTSSQSGLEAI